MTASLLQEKIWLVLIFHFYMHHMWFLVTSFMISHGTFGNSVTTVEDCAAPSPCFCHKPPAVYCFNPVPERIIDPECGGAVVVCGHRALITIPRFYSTDKKYASLDLSRNNITRVERDAFYNLSISYEMKLYLDNNPIAYIDDRAFVEFENTTFHLYLRNIRLVALPSALNNVDIMTTLKINGMKYLDSTIMMRLGQSLQTFEIDMRSMVEWPAEMEYLEHLRELYILGIRSLPTNAFNRTAGHLIFLTIEYSTSNDSLIMSDINETHVPDAICDLHHLNTLTLKYVNQSMTKAVCIPVCSTPLVTVRGLVFTFLNTVYFPEIFTTFPRVSAITITHSNIHHVNDLIIPSQNEVKYLDLAYNMLNRIPFAVNKMKNLRELHLKYNEITSLEANDLYNMSNLDFIYLNHNPIDFVSEMAFLNCTHVRILDLSYTRVSTIPQTLLHFPIFLNIRLPTIECSCALQWILGWDRRDKVKYYGSCYQSQETIFHFIEAELPRCEISPVG